MSETNQELIQQFYASFQASRSDLTSRLDSLKSKGTPSSDALNEITLEIAKLRKELTDAVAYLPTYDQRQYELHIKTIEKSLTDLRTASTSKSKFSFKRKQLTQTSSSVNTTASANPLTTDSRPTTNPSQSNSRILSDRSKEYLTLASLPESSTASDLTITNLDHCIVNLLPDNPDERRSITALHVRDVTNSIFILPSSIDGSAMFHNISKSIMVLGCHQFRMHTSNTVHIYLAISSSPIIEHCSDVSFASYPLILCTNEQERERTLKAANHDQVQDFSHIRPTPSPNWRVLPTTLQVKENWPVSPLTGDKLEEALSVLLPH